MCKKTVAEQVRECPRCRADLSILVDYVGDLQDGLSRAEELTRKGELGEAVWAYLEVLDVDPDNETARRQVRRVAGAVRRFDRFSAGRRWLVRMDKRAGFRRWLTSVELGEAGRKWAYRLGMIALLVTAFLGGYLLGQR
jgi:hypothetical protein